jgi:tetratricopeptide (TPR) repeat protein
MKFAVSIVLCLAVASPSFAAEGQDPPKLTLQQKRDESLDILFGQLRGSQMPVANSIEQKIWDIWERPLSDTAGVLMAQAERASNARELDAAKAVLDQVVDAYPDMAEGWNKRATVLYLRGDYDAALKDLDKTLELEPRHFGAMAGRGLIYQAQEKWGEALSAYRAALSINPAMGGVAEAIRWIEKVQPEI